MYGFAAESGGKILSFVLGQPNAWAWVTAQKRQKRQISGAKYFLGFKKEGARE